MTSWSGPGAKTLGIWKSRAAPRTSPRRSASAQWRITAIVPASAGWGACDGTVVDGATGVVRGRVVVRDRTLDVWPAAGWLPDPQPTARSAAATSTSGALSRARAIV